MTTALSNGKQYITQLLGSFGFKQVNVSFGR
jgi:hypothetical protein